MQKNIETYYVTKTILNRTGFLVFFSQACLEAGLRKRGLDAVNQSLQRGNETGELWFQSEAWRVKGELILMSERGRVVSEKEKAEALNCFQNAFRIAEEQKAKMCELRAVMSMAEFYKLENRRDEARKILEKTYGWFTEGFGTMDLQKARALLTSLQ